MTSTIEIARRNGDQRPPERLSFTRMPLRPEEPAEEKISVAALLKQGEALRTQAHHCQGCKANLPGRPFGCYGSVSYPLSARSEESLMSLRTSCYKCFSDWGTSSRRIAR